MDFAGIPLYDHHCHALQRERGPLDAPAFRRYFTESPDPAVLEHVPHTLFYRRALRDLAELLGCDGDEAAVIRARNERDPDDYARQFIQAANIDVMLVDTGLKADENLSIGEEQALLPCRVREVLRLENLAERLLLVSETFDELEERFRETIRGARDSSVVALKSIAAYRGGLRITNGKRSDASAEFNPVRHSALESGGLRLTNRPLIEYLVIAALEEAAQQQLPVQFHTGFGDPDLDLRKATPLLLRAIFEDPRLRTPIVLLHSYPFVRDAAYLANVYGNVFMDLSLTIPFTAHGGAAAIHEALELAPVSKVLLSTDAYSIPEIFYVGALGCRRSLASALHELLPEGWLSPIEAIETARKLLRENAVALYGSA